MGSGNCTWTRSRISRHSIRHSIATGGSAFRLVSRQHQRSINDEFMTLITCFSLQNLNGIEDIVDVILCLGEDDTYESAVEDHNNNLLVLLERYRENNIKLKTKKLQLRKQEVPYNGHLLTPDGLKPDSNKVKAILEMPTPTEKQSLQRLLGMITYLAKFLPNLSGATEPLRRLLDRDVGWH